MALFVIDSVLRDGVVIPIEQGSASIDNILGFEKEGVAEAGGNHDSVRKAVVPTIKAKVMLKPHVDPFDLSNMCDGQIVLRQSQFECKDAKPRRLRCSGCETASVGTVGADGFFDIEIIVKGRTQWL